MFLKLLKTDFKYYFHSFISIIISIFIADIFIVSPDLYVNFSFFNTMMLSGILRIISLIFLNVACFWTVFNIVRIFNKKCISSESYLTFSLPITKYHIIWSNVLLSLFWGFIILVLIILSIFLVFYFLFGRNIFNEYLYFIDNRRVMFIIKFIVLYIKTIILIYLSIILSNITCFKRYSKLLGVVFFAIFSYIELEVHIKISEFVNNYFDLDCIINGCVYESLVDLIISILFGVLFYNLLLYFMHYKLETD